MTQFMGAIFQADGVCYSTEMMKRLDPKHKNVKTMNRRGHVQSYNHREDL